MFSKRFVYWKKRFTDIDYGQVYAGQYCIYVVTRSDVHNQSKDRLCVFWWKVVDDLLRRRCASCKVHLDNSYLMKLNDYFAKLCSDDMYTESNLVTICNEVEIPVIFERQGWNSLSALKRTVTGPDQIPYWFGRSMQRFLRPLESLNLYSVFAIIVEAGDYHSSPQIGCS